ncbi:MAG: YbaB/EbfC family nucleoid-associated protein [Erysipelotrichaceae bacterium]
MDFNKLMQQANAMQKKMEKQKEEFNNTAFIGEASNGMVKITLLGNSKVEEVYIDNQLVEEKDQDILQDLVKIALNDALDKANKANEDGFSNLAGNMPKLF